jgi:hypothetical protein
MNLMSQHEPLSAFRVFPAASLLIILAACNTKPRPNFVFSAQGLSDQQFSRAEAECNLEAEKVAMRASNSVTAGEHWRKIHILCMEAKGAKYLGTSDQVSLDD